MNIMIEYLREINLCLWMFTFYIIAVSVGGFVTNILGPKLIVPEFFLRAYKYGKVSDKEKPNTEKSYTSILISYTEVPKRWFIHFYIWAAILSTAACYHVFGMYLQQEYRMYLRDTFNPPWLHFVLDYITTPYRYPVELTSCVISFLLFTLHVSRRLYECLFVSIFSSGKMNLLHYIVGHTHYTGVILVLISLAPSFGDAAYTEIQPGPGRNVNLMDVIGIIITILGSLIQHISLRTLASLRKNNKGEINHEAHVIPEGTMFELVTCPHMFAEILVYVGIFIVLDFHPHWAVILIWVTANQVQVAIMNHQWYKKTFKDYPIKRKAIFPYLL
ncbi:unnamed protein product [Meganyctiphanes norvegica]|uniref:Polyprenal reductase n=1 Tax=Meganyctiphanes norvegica TaxID=48144 RepID=A0AAV2PQA8_MEGNR